MKWYSTTPTDWTMNARINQLSMTDDVSFPPVLKAFSANAILVNLYTIMYKVYGGWQFDDSNYTTNFPVAFTDLKYGQSDYDLDTSVLTIKSVHIKDPNGSWVELFPRPEERMDERSTPTDRSQSGMPTRYFLKANSIFFDKVPDYDSAGGIRITFDREVIFITNPTSTTFTVGLPATWHELVCKGVSVEYLTTRLNPNDRLSEMYKEELDAFADHYRTRWLAMQPDSFKVRDTVRDAM